MPMRTALLALSLIALAAAAGTANAHYLVEQDTPLGPVCLVNGHDLVHALEHQDAEGALHAAASVPCDEGA